MTCNIETYLIGGKDSSQIVRGRRSLRTQGKRVSHLERRAHRQTLRQVRSRAVKEEARQVGI